MTNNQLDTDRTRTLAISGVMLLAVLTAFWTLSTKPLSNHECFVSVTAREMLANNDFVWPTCNGKDRLQKTPLNYWLVAGASKITGRVNEFATRLPSAVLGVLSAAAILYFLSRQLSFRIAAVSACVWTTSLGYARYTHNGRPEMVLTCFVTICFLSFYSAVSEDNRKRQIIYMLIFWASFALGNLAKGPVPVGMVGLPVFLYVLIFRQWKKVPKMLPILGTIIFLAILLPWPLAIAARVNWDLHVWKCEFVDRFFGDFASGDKPPYYYIGKMFQFMLPWVAFLPMALATPFFRVWDKKRPAMLFYWLCFVAGVVFLTVSGGKRQHYILPVLPVLAILTGVLIDDIAFARKAHTEKQAKRVLVGHVIVMLIIAIAGPIALLIVGKPGDAPLHFAKSNIELFKSTAIMAAAAIVLTTTIAAFFARGKRIHGTTAVFAGLMIIGMLLYSLFINPLNRNDPSRQFSLTLAKVVPPSDKLAAFEFVSNRTVHYFGRAIPEIIDPDELFEHYDAGGWVVATVSHLEKLRTDSRFKMVYFQKQAERKKHKDGAGAIFHKSAPKWPDQP